jgi:hypothetical protein
MAEELGLEKEWVEEELKSFMEIAAHYTPPSQ